MTLDVRDDLRLGREPFSRIMEAVTLLGDDESLRLIAPFEPAPLFEVMARRGFSHHSRLTETGAWEVVFTHNPEATAIPDKTGEPPPPRPVGESAREVDARGLEPPQPLVVILEALANLPDDENELVAHTDRRPFLLYDQLQERGFVGETKEHYDGSFVTTIRRS